MKKAFRLLIIELQHWFHVISNVHPWVWMGLWLILIPIFALIYWAFLVPEFRIPDDGGTNFGSWIYYSIVTITTLGFGDYTPAHGWAQAVTSVEVMCGLLCMGFFLNSVGAMKGEIDMTVAAERQRRLHQAAEKDKLDKIAPLMVHVISAFLRECQVVTSRGNNAVALAPDLAKSAARVSLIIDSFQNRVDLSLWPELMEKCFAFVANYQILSSDISSASIAQYQATEEVDEKLSQTAESRPDEIQEFIKENTAIAQDIQTLLNRITQEQVV